MADSRLLASRDDLGALAVFSGFDRDELQGFVGDWRLDFAPTETDAPYLVERVAWSEAAEALWSRATVGADNLTRVDLGIEDALVGTAGVVWLAPGRRLARIAVQPGWTDPFDFDALVGAAIAHALALDGRATLHGMAAKIDGVGVLALGDSMSGKTTLALAVLRAGGQVVSDDLLLLGGKVGHPEVRALRQDLYVREGSFALIPGMLSKAFSNASVRPGWRVLRRQDAPGQLVAAAHPRVVWFLGGGHCAGPFEAHGLRQAAALASIIASTSPLFVSGRYPKERERMLPALTAIVESASCFDVRLGAELLESPAIVVRELLAQTTAVVVRTR